MISWSQRSKKSTTRLGFGIYNLEFTLMDLYGEIILDHYKNPHHHGRIEQPTLWAEDANPLCGDKIRLDVVLDKDGRVSDVGFSGEGCAISQASTSMLTDELIGKTLPEIQNISNENVYEWLQVPLSPARVKCALLGLVVAKKAITLYKISA